MQKWILILNFFMLYNVPGFFQSGYILCSFVLLTELIGKTKRGLIGTLTQACFAVGIVIFSFIAYYIRHWRHLTLTTSILGVPLLVLSCLMLPESPIWLNSKGKLQEAIKVLKDIAAGNASKWDQRCLTESSSDTDNR